MWLDDVIAMFAFILIPVTVTSIIDLFYSDVSCTWFRRLRKPMWIVPDYIFESVWMSLLMTSGLASFIVWKTPERSFLPLLLYAVLLALTWGWTPIFFRLKSLFASLIIVALLIPTADLCTYVYFQVNPIAGYLLAPFPIWLIYIAYIHVSLYYLNKDLRAE